MGSSRAEMEATEAAVAEKEESMTLWGHQDGAEAMAAWKNKEKEDKAKVEAKEEELAAEMPLRYLFYLTGWIDDLDTNITGKNHLKPFVTANKHGLKITTIPTKVADLKAAVIQHIHRQCGGQVPPPPPTLSKGEVGVHWSQRLGPAIQGLLAKSAAVGPASASAASAPGPPAQPAPLPPPFDPPPVTPAHATQQGGPPRQAPVHP